jgi:hypothetical protein
MRRAAIAWTLVGLAAAALLAWIAGNTYWTNDPEPGFRSGEALFDSHYALRQFTQQLGVRLEVTGLLDPLPPPDGVLMLEDWNWSFSPAKTAAIRRWVEAGGRLLATEPEGTDKAFGAWAGAEWATVPRPGKKAGAGTDANDGDDGDAGAKSAPATPWQKDDRMASEDCLALRLQSGDAPSDPDASHWRLCNVATGHYWKAHRTPQLAIGTRDGPQLLRMGLGRGSVTFMQGDSSFNSCCLLEGDHGRLLVIALQLRHGDRLRLMSGNFEMSLVGWLWHVGAPLLLLLGAAILLALWRQLPRFGPLLPEAVRARRSLRAQVAGTASFLAHRGGGEALWQASCRALQGSAARALQPDENADPGRLVASLGRRGFPATAALERALLRPDLRSPAGLANEVATIERARRFVEAWSDRNSRDEQSIDRGKA